MKNYEDMFVAFEKSGIFIEEKYRTSIKNRLNEISSYTPKVGIFGKTGAGKSSLCNAVFGRDICEISDVAACTRNPQEVMLSMGDKGIKLIDVPGVGESLERDKEYADLYKKILPELDLVLWVLKGDDRAFSSDENFYKNLVKPYIEKGRPFFFVLNQVDKIEPFRDWDVALRRPGAKQAQNIEEKRRNVAAIFERPLTNVIPVSANERYGLVELVDNVIHSLPPSQQKIVIDEVSDEYVSRKTREEADKGWLHTIIETVKEVVSSIPVIGTLWNTLRSWW